MAEPKLFENDTLFRWKYSLFSALQHVIDYNTVGRYFYALLTLFETLQLLYFVFVIPQSYKPGYDYLQSAFDIFVYVPYVMKNASYDIYFYVWLIHILLILCFCMMTTVLLIKYHDTTVRPSFVGRVFIQMISLLLTLLKTILTIPSIYVFTVPFICTSDTVKCWSGGGIALSLISVVAVLLYILALFANELFNDSYINSALPWAAPDSKIGLLTQFFKVLLAFYVAVDPELDVSRYFVALVVLYSGYMVYYQYAGLRWYDKLTNVMKGFQICTLFWCFLVFYTIKMLGMTVQLDIALLNIVAGILLSAIFIVTQNTRIRVSVQNDITILNNENLAINCIGMVAPLPGKVQSDPESLWVLLGMLDVHREHCKTSDCICSAETSKVTQVTIRPSTQAVIPAGTGRRSSALGAAALHKTNALEKMIRTAAKAIEQNRGASDLFKVNQNEGKNKRPETGDYNPQFQWKDFLGLILDEVVAKFSKSVNLRLMVSYYQNMMEKNYYKAYFQLVKAGEKDCSYGQQFAIYRMKVILDKAIYAEETAKNSSVIELDLGHFRKFEGQRRQFAKIMRECTEKVIEFWNMLLSVNLKIDAMYVLGGKISTALKKVYSTFNEIIKIFPDHLQTYIGYAQFLRQVANNEIEADECFERANQIRRNIDVGRRQVHTETSNFSINRETGIVIASGNLDTFGIIQNFNEYTQVMFGYSYSDLIGLSINKLMPKVLASAHDKFMLAFSETGQSRLINQETIFPAKGKSGLLFQIALLVKTMPGLDHGLYYIAFMKKDPGNSRKGLAKLPYQCQKRGKLNFILTDMDGFIIGMSESTVRMLGIPKDYFEKAKYLFREPFNIKKINGRLAKPAHDDELKRGLVLTLKIRQIYEMIDKDFLSNEDAVKLEAKRPTLEVFMLLEVCEFRFGAKYRMFTFTPIKRESGHVSSNIDERKGDDEATGSEEDESSKFAPVESIAGSEESSGTQADKARALVKELKKNIFEHKESRQIVFFKRLIYLSFPMLLALSALDLAYNVVALNRVENSLKLDESSHLRRSLMAMMIEQFESYVNVALGREANVTTYEPNRELSLHDDILRLITRIQENEYKFQEYLRPVDVDLMSEISSSPGVLMEETYSDATVKSSTRGLISTVLAVTTRLNRIVNMQPIASLNTTFMAGVYNRTPKTRVALDQNEKDAYFVLRNGLYNTLNASTTMIGSIVSYHEDTLDDQMKKALIFHIFHWGILVFIVLVALPIMSNVQIGKRAILRFFAEVPKKKIEEILKRCEEFYTAELGKFNRPAAGKVAANMSSDYSRPLPSQISALSPQPPSKSPGNSPPVTPRSDQKQCKNHDLDDTKAKGEEADKDEDRVHEEDAFQKERKKRLLEYKAGIGSMFIVYLALMFLLAGYLGMIYYLQLQQKTSLLDNFSFVSKIQNKWFFMTAMVAYISAAQPTYQVLEYHTKKKYADIYFNLTLLYENVTDQMNEDYPSNQHEVVVLMRDFRFDFCDKLFEHAVVNTTRSTLSFCNHVQNKVTTGGMKVLFFYLMTEFRTQFFNTTYNVRVNSTSDYYLNTRIIFEYLFEPTLEFLAQKAKTLHYELVASDKVWIVLLMIGEFVALLVVLIVLVTVFARKLNDELWNAKGIVPLLPLDIIDKNSAIKELFSKQMNIII